MIKTINKVLKLKERFFQPWDYLLKPMPHPLINRAVDLHRNFPVTLVKK